MVEKLIVVNGICFFASKIGFISLKIYTPSNRGFPSSCENTKEEGMEH